MLVSLIYHRKLDDSWKHAALVLQEKLGIFIIGRSKGQKLVLAQDFVTETLTVNGETFRYRQTEGGFTQPNAAVCEKNAGMGMRLRPNAKRRPARTLLRQRQLHPAALPPLPPGFGHRSFQNLGTGGTMEHRGKRCGQHPHRQTVGSKNLPKHSTAAANSAACRSSKSTWPNTAFPPSSSIRRARVWTTTP